LRDSRLFLASACLEDDNVSVSSMSSRDAQSRKYKPEYETSLYNRNFKRNKGHTRDTLDQMFISVLLLLLALCSGCIVVICITRIGKISLCGGGYSRVPLPALAFINRAGGRTWGQYRWARCGCLGIVWLLLESGVVTREREGPYITVIGREEMEAREEVLSAC
jgi:hypothetical protein